MSTDADIKFARQVGYEQKKSDGLNSAYAKYNNHKVWYGKNDKRTVKVAKQLSQAVAEYKSSPDKKAKLPSQVKEEKKQNASAVRTAKAYVKKWGDVTSLKHPKAQAMLKREFDFEPGSDSKRGLFKEHQKVLKDYSERIKQSGQKTDAQAKTAKVPKSSRVPSRLKGIADKMRDNGKTGWVTINGMHINLGG